MTSTWDASSWVVAVVAALVALFVVALFWPRPLPPGGPDE